VAIIEALACGLPVLSTRCGGPETIITSDKLGILCNSDAESFAASLQDLVNNEYDNNFIRNFVVENFSARRISERLMAIYESEVIR
jgi:glycosyltransferase involved in cell wall biosynthesis